MTDREVFLDRIRKRRQQVHHFPITDPGTAVPRSVLGPEASTQELIDHFTKMLESVGGHATRVSDGHAAGEWLREFATDHDAGRAVVTGDVPVGNIATVLIEAGLRVTEPSRDGSFRDACIQADIGVTGADFAVADTGTLVLLARPEGPRSASLLPPVHVAVVRSDQFLPNLPALVERLRMGVWHDGQPSAMTLITGPSRTGDIEQTLSIGVHGPGEVCALIIEERSSDRGQLFRRSSSIAEQL